MYLLLGEEAKLQMRRPAAAGRRHRSHRALDPGGRAGNCVRRIGAATALALALAAAPGVADAYPQFQLATGNTRCSVCHIAPAGGGLINEYGRGESGDTISQFGGDGSFLYGAYEEPSWLKLGVDLRGAALAKDNSTNPEYVLFPMQGDTYVYLKGGSISLYGVVGPRAQIRETDAFIDRFGSREYWLMWRPKTTGWYARAGRFFAPFGLRSQDHTTYVRRYLGLHSWEETYNVSFGNVSDESEIHVTAFTPVPYEIMGNGPRASGATALYEKRVLEDKAVIGPRCAAAIAETDRTYLSAASASTGPSRPRCCSWASSTWHCKTSTRPGRAGRSWPHT